MLRLAHLSRGPAAGLLLRLKLALIGAAHLLVRVVVRKQSGRRNASLASKWKQRVNREENEIYGINLGILCQIAPLEFPGFALNHPT